jgi:hypothetical protein
VHDVVHFLALSDVDWGKAVSAAAPGECRVFGCAAAIDGDIGVEPEDLGEDVLKVCAGFEVSERDVFWMLVGAKAVQDYASELIVDIRMADKEIERPAK